jgi:FKBP-type peptidyl-prolyl cis-trans isomerase
MDLQQLPAPVLETLSYQEGFTQGEQLGNQIPNELQQQKYLEGFRDATRQALDEQAMLYAAGGHSARQAMQQGLHPLKMLAGLEDKLAGTPPAYTQEQIAEAFQRFQHLQQQSLQNAGGSAAENLAAGRAFLTENGAKDNVITTDSGLQYTILQEGEGAKPGAADTVTVHYTGRLLNGTVFDSSVQRGEPIEFPLNRVIPGWTEGVQLMSPGAKYRFWIPANLAYGEQAPASIGPNQVLDFDVELLHIAR